MTVQATRPGTAGAPRSARPLWATVDTDALVHNLREVRRRLRPGLDFAVSLKAHAYGHGAVEVASICEREGARYLMSASLEDAYAIAQSGVRTKVVLLAACLPEAIGALLDAGVTPTIYSLEAAEAVSQASRRPTPVHVKVDAGLGRVGVDLDDAEAFVRRVAVLPDVVIEGIYTHLPFGDPAGAAWARRQLERFVGVVRSLTTSGIEIPIVQAMSTAGLGAGIDAPELTCVCIGSALYGIPSGTMTSMPVGVLRRAYVRVEARLIAVRHHPVRRRAGRGGARTYEAGSSTGVVPVGFGDGYRPGPAGADAAMLLDRIRVPILSVTLAQTTIDLTRAPHARVGDVMVLVGGDGEEQIPLEDVGRWCGMSALELVLAFDGHIPRDYRELGARCPVPAGAKAAAGY